MAEIKLFSKIIIEDLFKIKKNDKQYSIWQKKVTKELLAQNYTTIKNRDVQYQLLGVIDKFFIHGHQKKSQILKKLSDYFLNSPIFEKNENLKWSILSFILNLSNHGIDTTSPCPEAELSLTEEVSSETESETSVENEALDFNDTLSEWSEDDIPKLSPLKAKKKYSKSEGKKFPSIFDPSSNEVYTEKNEQVAKCDSDSENLQNIEENVNWLQLNLQPRYWEIRSGELILLTEYNILRECIWALQFPEECFLFNFSEKEMKIKPVKLSTLSENSLKVALVPVGKSAGKLREIDSWISDYGNKKIYLNTAYLKYYSEALKIWRRNLNKKLFYLEEEIAEGMGCKTIIWLSNKLEKTFENINVVHNIHSNSFKGKFVGNNHSSINIFGCLKKGILIENTDTNVVTCFENGISAKALDVSKKTTNDPAVLSDKYSHPKLPESELFLLLSNLIVSLEKNSEPECLLEFLKMVLNPHLNSLESLLWCMNPDLNSVLELFGLEDKNKCTVDSNCLKIDSLNYRFDSKRYKIDSSKNRIEYEKINGLDFRLLGLDFLDVLQETIIKICNLRHLIDGAHFSRKLERNTLLKFVEKCIEKKYFNLDSEINNENVDIISETPDLNLQNLQKISKFDTNTRKLNTNIIHNASNNASNNANESVQTQSIQRASLKDNDSARNVQRASQNDNGSVRSVLKASQNDDSVRTIQRASQNDNDSVRSVLKASQNNDSVRSIQRASQNDNDSVRSVQRASQNDNTSVRSIQRTSQNDSVLSQIGNTLLECSSFCSSTDFSNTNPAFSFENFDSLQNLNKFRLLSSNIDSDERVIKNLRKNIIDKEKTNDDLKNNYKIIQKHKFVTDIDLIDDNSYFNNDVFYDKEENDHIYSKIDNYMKAAFESPKNETFEKKILDIKNNNLINFDYAFLYDVDSLVEDSRISEKFHNLSTSSEDDRSCSFHFPCAKLQNSHSLSNPQNTRVGVGINHLLQETLYNIVNSRYIEIGETVLKEIVGENCLMEQLNLFRSVLIVNLGGYEWEFCSLLFEEIKNGMSMKKLSEISSQDTLNKKVSKIDSNSYPFKDKVVHSSVNGRSFAETVQYKKSNIKNFAHPTQKKFAQSSQANFAQFTQNSPAQFTQENSAQIFQKNLSHNTQYNFAQELEDLFNSSLNISSYVNEVEFTVSLQNCIASVDPKLAGCFSVSVSSNVLKPENLISDLKIEISDLWPLSLVINDSVLEKYNRLFGLSLVFKRALSILEQLKFKQLPYPENTSLKNSGNISYSQFFNDTFLNVPPNDAKTSLNSSFLAPSSKAPLYNQIQNTKSSKFYAQNKSKWTLSTNSKEVENSYRNRYNSKISNRTGVSTCTKRNTSIISGLSNECVDLPLPQRLHRLQLLRQWLLYFVSSLYNYFTISAIIPFGEKIKNLPKNVRHFDQFISEHEKAVKDVCRSCFLLDNQATLMQKGLLKAFEIVDYLQKIWNGPASDINSNTLEMLEQRYSMCYRLVNSYLSTLPDRSITLVGLIENLDENKPVNSG